MSLAKAIIPAGTAAVQLVTGAGGLHDINIREVDAVAAVAQITLYDNTSAAGTILGVMRLAADGTRQATWAKGVRFSIGVHAVITGSINGSIAYGSSGALRPYHFTADAAPLFTGPANLDSLLLAETAGAAAEARIFDGLAIAGQSMAGAVLAANETTKLSWPNGVKIGAGVTADVVAGAVAGTVYLF